MFQLKGVGVALITPFDNENKIDYPSLQKIIDHVINNGVDFIVSMGTTGETPTLTSDEKAELLSKTIEMNAARVPLVLGVGGNDTSKVVEDIKKVPSQGVDAILSVAPYYNKPTQAGIYAHFHLIAQNTPLPIILYNVPGRTSSNILPQTALKLARAHKNIIGIKDACGNFPQFMSLIKEVPDHFSVVSGDDDLVLPSIAVGMRGVISVAANCYTKDFCDMVHFAMEGNYDLSRKLHYKLLNGIGLLFKEGNPAGVKYVMSKLGLALNNLRLPLVKVSEELAEEIDQELIQIF